ncbi:MAG: glucose-6-phosphate isomerase family protein [Candidatus Paceibacterota bacterium]
MENFCEKGKIEYKIGYDVCRGKDWQGDLRYDLTLIYAKDTARELPRTFGHYHTQGYAELFEVIEGKTMAFIQQYGAESDIIEKAYLIEASKGDKFIILPDFGFTNINPDKSKNLLLSNWTNVNVKNQYDLIKKYNGFCYRALRNGNGNITFEKNENYKKIPELIKLKPKELPKELKNLDFLSEPEKYKDVLRVDKLFKLD